MEGTNIENTGTPSTKVDETNAEGKAAVAARSKDQELDFEIIDSLHRAATEGKISEDLKKHGKQLDRILTPSGNTILHIYIISHSDPPKTAEFVREVLGMCPNLLLKANKKGETPLHFAARYGHDDIVKELLEECQKPCYKDQENGVERKRLMLEETNEAKDTALHEAVLYNHIDVVNKLIDEDAEVPYDANGSGETPLYLAAERGYTEVVRKILDKSKSAVDHGPMGRTALHAAVIRGDIDMAKDLLKYFSNKKDERGRFALHYAASLGYDEIVDELLKSDRSAAYEADSDGKTALHLAAGNGKAKAVNKLIEMCPNCCELVDKRDRNALHLALTSADDSTIEIFLNNPALRSLLNQKDKEGNTPLLQLANSGSYIRTFISHDKVDKLVFNKENKNAADIILDKDLMMVNRDKFLSDLNEIKEKCCRRIIDPKQEVRKGRVDWPYTIGFGKVSYVKPKEERSEDVMKGKGDGSEEIIEIIKGAGETHLVAATLIATVTFAAGFTLPGGYVGADNPNEGTALLTRSGAFQAFVIFDTAAFVLSCASVLIHLTMGLHKDTRQLVKQFKRELRLTSYAMVAMVFAFITGLYAVSYPDKSLAITACVIGCLFGAYFYAKAINMGKFIEEKANNSWLKKKKPTKVKFYKD